jgi:hypothetical protein
MNRDSQARSLSSLITFFFFFHKPPHGTLGGSGQRVENKIIKYIIMHMVLVFKFYICTKVLVITHIYYSAYLNFGSLNE